MSTASVASAFENVGNAVSQPFDEGQRLFAEGRYVAAAAEFEVALAAAPDQQLREETLADLHARLANALLAAGRLEPAAHSYKAALRLVPGLTHCWCNLGNVHLQQGCAQEAIALYLEALRLSPGHWPSRTNLVQALIASEQFDIAKVLLAELIGERPEDTKPRHELGKLHFQLNEFLPALAQFEAAAALHPSDVDSLYWIAALRQKLGDDGSALDAYREAAQLRPVIRRAAARRPADFRILALYAPFGGNTPADYLFSDAAYDADTLVLLPDCDIDVDCLDDDYQLVVNLVSEADQSQAMVHAAAAVARRIGLPVINDPAHILQTTRGQISELLRDLPGCKMPQTLRVAAGDDAGAAKAAFPCLVRPAGTHGGELFERIGSLAEFSGIVAARLNSDHYLIEYVDYRSADGYFRKYRLIFVGEEIFPYHLAIGSDWKLHRDSAGMEEHSWMEQEETAFLRDPWSVLGAHREALQQIGHRVGLDYFGIDCGLDTGGRLVVFEVNASMLVHDEAGALSHKSPYIRRIKTAFEAMLASARLT